MSQTFYIIQPVRNGRPLKSLFYDGREPALQMACLLLHLWMEKCDGATRKTLDRLWREGKYLEEIRTWNQGHFGSQMYVFEITVDPSSELELREE